MEIEVREISFEEARDVWKTHLWVDRESAIRHVSSIDFNLEVNMDLYEEDGFFVGAFIDGEIVGVNSGYRTSNQTFRSRGLWVKEEHRSKGISKKLLTKTEEKAVEYNCLYMWSLPRLKAMYAYSNFGFFASHLDDEVKMEYGPNLFAVKILDA